MRRLEAGCLIGQYTVVGWLGNGASSEVYEVKHDGEHYALKIFTGRQSSDEMLRFNREGEVLRSIEHKQVVKYISEGTLEGYPYLLLELVKGKNLKLFFDQKVGESGDFPIRLASHIFIQVCSILSFILEGKSYIHRDLKLENIMILEDQKTCKLIDFGLVRDLKVDSKLPTSWEFNGAPRYRAPEKWKDFHSSDEKAEIWSLGVIYYYLLTGTFAFTTQHDDGSENELMAQILKRDVIPPSHLNDRATQREDLLIRLMLSKVPSSRPTFRELTTILMSGCSSIETVVNEVFSKREAPKGKSLNVASSLGSFDSDYFESLSDAEYRSDLIEKLRAARSRSLEILIRCNTHWGPACSSNSPRVANVCEVILGYSDYMHDSTGLLKVAIPAVQWLLKQQTKDGFPSLSYNLATTQCTALALLALSSIKNSQALDKSLLDDVTRSIDKAVESCILLAGEKGWGTWKNTTVRIQPTIFAILSLVASTKSLDINLLERYDQLRSMHSLGSPGVFGFKPGAPGRIATTAGYLLLCNEIEKLGFVAENPERYYLEKYNAINFLIENWRNQRHWASEVESFQVDLHVRPLLSNIEHLSWNHVSAPLAIKALTEVTFRSGFWDEVNVWFTQALELSQRMLLEGLIKDSVLHYPETDLLYPTAYASWALCSVQNWLASYEKVRKVPLCPPKPEIRGKLIEKCAGAIIINNRILLVRKYGTDKLIMPGGGIEEGEDPTSTLAREVQEELKSKVIVLASEPLGIYRAPAAFEKGVDVQIILYLCKLDREPAPNHEIEELVWYSASSDDSSVLSMIVREKIIPDLLRRGILH